jgi:predicted DNA binding CopG/RHH family protein
MTDDKTDVEVDEDVELGEQVANTSRARVRGATVAVRISPDLLARVQEYASARGITLSEVLRRGAEQLVAGTVHLGPTYITGSVMVSGTNLVNGSPSGASGRSPTWEDEPERPAELTVPG